jgi:hypothetical protein
MVGANLITANLANLPTLLVEKHFFKLCVLLEQSLKQFFSHGKIYKVYVFRN